MMEKFAQACEDGGGGARPGPFTLFTLTYKDAVYVSAERGRYTPPVSSTVYPDVLFGLNMTQ